MRLGSAVANQHLLYAAMPLIPGVLHLFPNYPSFPVSGTQRNTEEQELQTMSPRPVEGVAGQPTLLCRQECCLPV